MGVLVRPTAAHDLPALDKLVKQVARHHANAANLLETALLCLTAVDTEHDNLVVGFLCLDDTPVMRMDPRPCAAPDAAAKWLGKAVSMSPLLGVVPTSASAYARVAAVLPDYEVEAAAALLRGALVTVPALRSLLLGTQVDITFDEPGLGALMEREGSDKATGAILYSCSRASLLPPLLVRAARVEDHDDMLPILQRASTKFPALAKLPEASRPEEPFALTRVVGGQNDFNRVFVAEADGRLVGFMVVTSEVETSSLLGTFDLHPFDNFLPSEVYELQFAEARTRAARRKRDNALKKAAAELAEAQRLKEEAGGDPEQEAAETQTDPPAEEGADGEAAAADGDPAAAAAADGEAEVAPPVVEVLEPASEEEVRAEMLRMFGPEADYGATTAPLTSSVEPTIFAITMMCVNEEFEAQATEFLREAFAAFPMKEYCVVTLPHDSPEPPLTGAMTRVPPSPGSLFPEVLYLFNRHALEDDFEVRMALESDTEAVENLAAGMTNMAEILNSFATALERQSAAVATCEGQVVGLCTLNPRVDLALLQANFALSALLDLQHHPPERHGEIDMYCINPIFVYRHRAFLTGVQRLFKRSVLYYALPPGQQPPDMLDVLSQVPPRHRIVAASMQADFALYLFNRRSAFVRKRAVNAQVVVVGASECGLAAIERLLLDPEFQFNYLTLLAPQGISVGGVTCQYTAGVIAKLGLEARVALLDAEMVGLDRSRRAIELSDGSALAYDLLLITSGLQDQTRNVYSEQDADAAGFVLNALELASEFSLGDAQVMQSIVVYGCSLAGYQAMSTLEARGVTGNKLRFVAAPGPDEGIVDLLHDVAVKVQANLPMPERLNMQEVKTNWQYGAATANAIFQSEDLAIPPETLQVDLIVGSCPAEIGRQLFQCFNDSSLVFDGRLVVDGAFRTNDPRIYAAGTIAKLSRRYAFNVHYEHYNSREVGQALACSVAAYFRGEQRPDVVPKLTLAKVLGCNIPGNQTFMYSARAASLASPTLEAPMDGSSVCTTSDSGYMLLNLDVNSCIDSLAYLGKVPVQPSKLSSLVGLHTSFLNGILDRHDGGQIGDFLKFLVEPWADLLYHDEFPAFRAAMVRNALDALAGRRGLNHQTTTGGTATKVVAASPVDVTLGVQDETLEFIRSKIVELPLYNVPPIPTGIPADSPAALPAC